MAASERIALGLRARTGSAAVVVLAGAATAPRLVAKSRIVMATTFETGAVYHAAQALSAAAAAVHVAKSERTFEALAVKALESLREEGAAGARWVGAALVSAAAKPMLPLTEIVRAHPRVHAAEGEFYRRIVEQAAVASGLPTQRIASSELLGRVTKATGLSTAEVERLLAALGKVSGPPWTQEQKECALAAWSVLGER